jgi:hypothetical protein
MRALVVLVLLLVATSGLALAPDDPDACPASSNPVVRWNEAVLTSIKAEKTPPPVAARNLALVHIAAYDSVALATGDYRPLRSTVRPPAGADPAAAVAVAAHRVLIDLYPSRVATLDAVLDATLDGVPEGPAKSRGVEFGQAVAEQLLKGRAGDTKVASQHSYKPSEIEGRWRSTPPGHAAPLLPGWGNIKPFAVADPSKFRPPGPPKLDSEAYKTSFRTVRSLGSTTSTDRTKDQTEIARFWEDGVGTVTPPGHWNRIAQSLAAEKKLGLGESARLFALLNVAMADASIVCWDCKFRFDVWRPVTAIREVEPTWEPLLPTPPFPAYTSGHSSFSGSAAAALSSFFGTDRVRFSSTSDGLPGVTRSFDSFRAAAEEAGMSRIYGGIHWMFDNTDGLAGGREIAEHVAERHFRPAVRKQNDLPALVPVPSPER